MRRLKSFFKKYGVIILAMGLVFSLLTLSSLFAAGPDSSGASTGGVADIPAATLGKPTLEEIAGAVGHNRVAINFVWTLVAGFLVMFMQPGFAMVETGLTRAKNVAHTMAMNFMVYPLGMLGFYICGFALMFGGLGALGTMGGYAGLNHEFTVNLFGKTFGLFGVKGFFLSGSSYDVAVFTLFLFQMVFMDTAATIPTGAFRKMEIPFFLYLCFVRRDNNLSYFWKLGLGRWLAGDVRAEFSFRPRPCGFCRFFRCAFDGWRDRLGWRLDCRPASREVQQRWQR